MIRIFLFLVVVAAQTTALAINSQSFFKDTISEYKKDFKNRSVSLYKADPSVRPGQAKINLVPPVGNLTAYGIDYLVIPSEKKKNLVIIQSGIHGIEGLAGGGIQNFLLDYFHAGKKKFINTTFLYIHMVNPYGVDSYRRTNLNNVDLNRNFVSKAEDFKQKNEDYGKINLFLNPEFAFEGGFLKKISYYFQSLSMIWKYSIDTLRRSILKGQYAYPMGIYFGGSDYQPEFQALKTIWDLETEGYENIFYVDLHTGYGEKGRLHLLAGDSESEISQKLKTLFDPTPIDFGNTKNFYQTTGDVLTYFLENYKRNNEIFPITFEFGTLNSQSTLGSMDSLYRMISENQAHSYKSANTASAAQVKKMFKDMFYPSDFEWRDKVLTQTQTQIEKILKYSEL